MDISLPNPPSSLSNQQHPVGVIVKYDTSHKLNPIQLTHSNVEKVWLNDNSFVVHCLIFHCFCIKSNVSFQIHSHHIGSSQSQTKPHQVLQYKKLPEIVAAAAAAATAAGSTSNNAQKMPIL